MTREELRKSMQKVKWEYKYEPCKKTGLRPIKYPPDGHYRTFLGDSEVTSNVIGRDSDNVLKMFCHDSP